MFEFKWVRGHVEVYLNGVFQFSADNVLEARNEIDGDIATPHNNLIIINEGRCS